MKKPWWNLFEKQSDLAWLLRVKPSAVSNWYAWGLPDCRKWQILSFARRARLDLDVDSLERIPPGKARKQDACPPSKTETGPKAA